MLAAYAQNFSTEDPLSGLVVGERPEPEPRAGWTTVRVKAASLNHHDLWSLRGVGLREESLPMILGCDSSRRPTPRRDHRSWWFREAALTRTVVHPARGSGSGRSPTTRPDSGSSVEKFCA